MYLFNNALEWALESTDSSADYSADPTKISVWVWGLRHLNESRDPIKLMLDKGPLHKSMS